jgi:NAD(P)H-dependent flavin oxidoreductase YrpB (nitropropane dioxygenase family)
MWPNARLTKLFGIEHPIVLAPMAGAMDLELVAAVSAAGGLGSLPCAMLTANAISATLYDKLNFNFIRDTAPVASIMRVPNVMVVNPSVPAKTVPEFIAYAKANPDKLNMASAGTGCAARPAREGPRRTDRPVNVNFFCHTPPVPNNAREARWRDQLKPYYEEFGIDPALPVPSSNRRPFDAAFCAVVEELKPQVVSFHFGLPEASLVRRVKAAGCVLISEAVFLERHGVDAVIAQGYEAGGHRGMFLTEDIATQVGTFALGPRSSMRSRFR